MHWRLTTSRVLTLDLVSGLKVTDREGLDAAGADRAGLARLAARALMKMVFEDGLFHADPHPGNFFVKPDGRLGLIDFGMVGSVEERTRRQLAELLVALMAEDPERLVDAFVDLGAIRGHVDRASLGDELLELARSSSGRPLDEVPVGQMIQEAPSGLAQQLRPHGRRVPLQHQPAGVRRHDLGQPEPGVQRHPQTLGHDDRLEEQREASGRDLARLLARSPRQVQHLLDDLERGGFEVGVRGADVERVLSRLEALVNRVVLAVLATGFIMGLAALMTVYHPPGWQAWAGFAFGFGLLLASVIGFYLAWSILRSGRS